MMKDTDVKDAADMVTYMRIHATRIFVREKVNGKWDAYSLAELPDRLRSEHELRFLEEARVPVRLLTDEEMAENAKQEKDKKGN
jgi:hypothetical protein